VIDCVVGSPPYGEHVRGGHGKAGEPREVEERRLAEAGYDPAHRPYLGGPNGQLALPRHYGTAPGQLGALAAGAAPVPGGDMTEVKTLTWEGCYDSGWGGLMGVREAYAHPAKYSRNLIRQIYAHMIQRGWIEPGQTVMVTGEILRQIKAEIERGEYTPL
jgi:hypothetical protein